MPPLSLPTEGPLMQNYTTLGDLTRKPQARNVRRNVFRRFSFEAAWWLEDAWGALRRAAQHPAFLAGLLLALGGATVLFAQTLPEAIRELSTLRVEVRRDTPTTPTPMPTPLAPLVVYIHVTPTSTRTAQPTATSTAQPTPTAVPEPTPEPAAVRQAPAPPPPTAAPPAPNLYAVTLTHQNIPLHSHPTLKYEQIISVTGARTVLDRIAKVSYGLHPTINPPVVGSDNRAENFAISIKVWGQTTVTADVHFKDGRLVKLSRYLAF